MVGVSGELGVGFWLLGASGGFDSGRSFLATRLNQLRGRGAHVLAQPVSKGGFDSDRA